MTEFTERLGNEPTHRALLVHRGDGSVLVLVELVDCQELVSWFAVDRRAEVEAQLVAYEDHLSDWWPDPQVVVAETERCQVLGEQSEAGMIAYHVKRDDGLGSLYVETATSGFCVEVRKVDAQWEDVDALLDLWNSVTDSVGEPTAVVRIKPDRTATRKLQYRRSRGVGASADGDATGVPYLGAAEVDRLLRDLRSRDRLVEDVAVAPRAHSDAPAGGSPFDRSILAFVRHLAQAVLEIVDMHET